MAPRYDVESGQYADSRGLSEKPFSILSYVPKRFIKFFRKGSPTRWIIGLIIIFLLCWIFSPTISLWKRDLGYIFRPIWDTPEKPWNHITQYAIPGDIREESVRRKWCDLHKWDVRSQRELPKVVDAILFSSELDLLEIRMREYEPYVSTFIIVESNMTFSGAPKPTYFKDNRHRFDFIPEEKIVHHVVTNFETNLPVGSFDNEIKQRIAIGDELRNLARQSKIGYGDLIIESDVDEIISRQTLSLLTTCKSYPLPLHLNVDNYRYSFEFPLNDGGYYRPKVVQFTDANSLDYNHQRKSNDLLGGSGWHCSFCFSSLSEIKMKMMGYSHNDRVRNKALLETKRLRQTVCEGRDPFDMYPEAFTFKDLIAQSGKPRKANSFNHIPIALKENPDKYDYLLDGGCFRPE
ncbi:uncharacterized protein I303_106069 [Kwoniella dejecticola CBS 10117]|uniref:Beta-1,4-mannosyl-glycoprotein beta-1,4-N-acetylglucosaminyltransferase n=1 Tax=Kwoniella dejecticola CBS 10117 TaxID=1296121 RepID=A0A1A6A168_9TREE|nr:uncharacterized protein I303_06089 [Kwoniella dejecticola CBS 10117]OBR83806.1 hypothetical protein I303_06089 [Kwoniella dejecticola CBS 10117]